MLWTLNLIQKATRNDSYSTNNYLKKLQKTNNYWFWSSRRILKVIQETLMEISTVPKLPRAPLTHHHWKRAFSWSRSKKKQQSSSSLVRFTKQMDQWLTFSDCIAMNQLLCLTLASARILMTQIFSFRVFKSNVEIINWNQIPPRLLMFILFLLSVL